MSYMLVLLLPMILFMAGIFVVYWNLEKENRIANQIKMEHSIQLIDKSLSALHSLATQATGTTAVKKIAALETVETATIFDFKDGIDTLTTMLKYQEQSVGFIEAHYVYFNKTDYCYYEETLYQGKIFDKYLPHQTSYTLSSKNNAGGRPENTDPISASTIQTKANNSNNQPKPSTK